MAEARHRKKASGISLWVCENQRRPRHLHLALTTNSIVHKRRKLSNICFSRGFRVKCGCSFGDERRQSIISLIMLNGTVVLLNIIVFKSNKKRTEDSARMVTLEELLRTF